MRFYTYLWLRSNGTPYYVGKGRGNRVYNSHPHHRPPKDRTRIIIFPMLNEAEAFESEKALIELFGRKDSGTGILRNLTDGGEGPAGWKPSEAIREAFRVRGLRDAASGKLKAMNALSVAKCKGGHNLGGLKRAKNLTEQRFGNLVAKHRVGRRGKSRITSRLDTDIVLLCKCDCGNAIRTTSGLLLSGHTKSCGCLIKKVAAAWGKRCVESGQLAAMSHKAVETGVSRARGLAQGAENVKSGRWASYKTRKHQANAARSANQKRWGGPYASEESTYFPGMNRAEVEG